MVFISLKECIGNAFIDYVEQTGRRKLSMEKIIEYQNKIVQLLNARGIHAKVYTFNNERNLFFREYEEIFSYNEKTNEVYFNESFDTNYLRKRFRVLLGLDLLYIFTDKKIIEFLVT